MNRPNILLLFTDQQRHDTLHAGGNPIIKTPALDRLCREGTRFSSAYTPSPVCISARCALIHGLYAHQTGCARNSDPMPEDKPTMMQALTEGGYRTHGIGKMHFTPDTYALRGFQSRERQVGIPRAEPDDDYMLYLADQGFDHVYDPGGVRGDVYYIPQTSQLPARLHPTQWVGDRAISFIEEADGAQPFFLFASFIHPHPPFSPPTPWNKLYRAANMLNPKQAHRMEELCTFSNRQQNRRKGRDDGIDHNLFRVMRAYYYACISFIDYQVARIVQALEASGRLDDTLILFTSDHGEFLGDYDCVGKRSMLDPAARVPMIARYPTCFAPGSVCNTPVSLVDVMPTCLTAAGEGVRAVDLPGADLGEIAAQERRNGEPDGARTIYSQFAHADEGLYMALNQNWKYYYSAADRREVLLDRLRDPQETRNCAGNWYCQDTLESMRADLMNTLQSEGTEKCLDGDRWSLFPRPSLSPESVFRPYMDRGESHINIPGYTA